MPLVTGQKPLHHLRLANQQGQGPRALACHQDMNIGAGLRRSRQGPGGLPREARIVMLGNEKNGPEILLPALP